MTALGSIVCAIKAYIWTAGSNNPSAIHLPIWNSGSPPSRRSAAISKRLSRSTILLLFPDFGCHNSRDSRERRLRLTQPVSYGLRLLQDGVESDFQIRGFLELQGPLLLPYEVVFGLHVWMPGHILPEGSSKPRVKAITWRLHKARQEASTGDG